MNAGLHAWWPGPVLGALLALALVGLLASICRLLLRRWPGATELGGLVSVVLCLAAVYLFVAAVLT